MTDFRFVKMNSNKKADLVAAKLNRRHARKWQVGDIIAPIARYRGPDYWAEYEVWGVIGHLSQEETNYISSYEGKWLSHNKNIQDLVGELNLPEKIYIVSERRTYGATCAIFTGDDRCHPHENVLSIWVNM